MVILFVDMNGIVFLSRFEGYLILGVDLLLDLMFLKNMVNLEWFLDFFIFYFDIDIFFGMNFNFVLKLVERI